MDGGPNQGVGPRQPGGWIYQAAPYLEQNAVTLLGAGLEGEALKQALTEQAAVTIPSFNCPTRRPAEPLLAAESILFNCNLPTYAAKSDYAANGGHTISLKSGSVPPNATATDCRKGFPNCSWQNSDLWLAEHFKGIVGDHTGARIAEVTDGTSTTIAAGEKWVHVDFHFEVTKKDIGPNQQPSDNPADNGSMYLGYDWDTVRAISGSIDEDGDEQGLLPVPDTQGAEGNTFPERMGSAHSEGLNVVMCDGSVHFYTYDIDPWTWGAMGNREDGLHISN